MERTTCCRMGNADRGFTLETNCCNWSQISGFCAIFKLRQVLLTAMVISVIVFGTSLDFWQLVMLVCVTWLSVGRGKA
ncbi:hypothetical protein [Lysinibacillus sp. NPDC056185]|uniref:hypothetical protein n=1 Tax=Lysinibacillus sp. NPDC056185 TaxID=3345739 RepID=UPI0039F043E5